MNIYIVTFLRVNGDVACNAAVKKTKTEAQEFIDRLLSETNDFEEEDDLDIEEWTIGEELISKFV